MAVTRRTDCAAFPMGEVDLVQLQVVYLWCTQEGCVSSMEEVDLASILQVAPLMLGGARVSVKHMEEEFDAVSRDVLHQLEAEETKP